MPADTATIVTVALVGAAGVTIGAVIGALGAYIVARMNREEARAARFADRVREIAAQLLETIRRYNAAAGTQMLMRHEGATKGLIRPELGNTYPQLLQELRLIARRSETLQAVDQVSDAMHAVQGFVSRADPAPPLGPGAVDAFMAAEHKLADGANAFEDAVRLELGSPIIPRLRPGSGSR